MGLSPVMVDQIFEALRRVTAKGATLLLVEQYVTRALDIADEVLLMTKGSILLRGPASEFTESRISQAYLGGGAEQATTRISRHM